MIPIKLTLRGIHSYRETQIIEFDKLTEAGLFGIFGKVGSGKSTILEAISFVLFGKRERASNYDLFNLRSDKLLIDFECRAGRDNHLYRFVVDGRRNGKQFDKVSVDRKAYQWLPELKDWSPIDYEDPAEKIIGLSYDNFKRTIIIPQGRFQDFIDLGDTERTKMLKELFKLERFDLSKQVSSIKGQNKDLLTENQAQIDAIGDVSQDIIAQKEHDLKTTKELFLIENKSLGLLQKEAIEVEQLRQNIEKLTIEKAKTNELNKQIPVFEQRQKSLKHYEYCFLNFKSLFERRTEYVQKVSRNQTELNQSETTFKTIQEKLDGQTKTLGELRPQYDSRQEIKDEATELKKIIEIKETITKQQKTEDRILKGVALLKEQNEAITKRQEILENLKTQYQKAKESLPDLLQLAEVNAWFGQNKHLTEARKKLKDDAEALVEKEKKERQSVSQIAVYEGLSLVENLLADVPITQIVERLKTIQQQKKQESSHLDQSLIQLATQKALQQYANNLTNGQPCPLCGSVHHPEALSSSDDVEAHIQTIKNQQLSLSNLSDFVSKAISKLENVQSNLDNLAKQKADIKTNWTAQTEAIDKHKQAFVWLPTFSPDQPEGIETAFANAKTKKAEIEILEKQIETETKTIEADKQTTITKYEKPIDVLRTEVAALQSVTESLQGQLVKLHFQDFMTNLAEDLNKKVSDLELQYQKITTDFEILDKAVAQQTNEQSQVAGAIKTLGEALQNSQKDLLTVETELVAKIEKSEFENELDIVAILKNTLDIDAERADIQAFEQNVALAQAAVQELVKTVGSQVFEAEKEQELKIKITDLLITTSDLQKKEGSLTTELTTLNAQFIQQIALQEARKILEARQANINLIDTMFRSNGFINYVSSVYLQNLCNQANERFYRMTRQQLQLEVFQKDGKYDFQVRDLLNDGRTRALSSLSGGQKFQASLSLALALADSIHTQNEMKENFFFLDEGFGSLDKEALQVVFETLKSLRRENRIVGIISHVEDLQQEIDRYLVVTNDEELGSLVAVY